MIVTSGAMKDILVDSISMIYCLNCCGNGFIEWVLKV